MEVLRQKDDLHDDERNAGRPLSDVGVHVQELSAVCHPVGIKRNKMIHLERSLVSDGTRCFLVLPLLDGLIYILISGMTFVSMVMLTATEIGATRRCDVSELIINKLSRTM